MNTKLFWAIGLFLIVISCQSESLDIRRTFPFQLQLDAFPPQIPIHKPTSVGFSIRPEYLMSGNAYTFTWQITAPQQGIMVLNHQVVSPGGKALVFANAGKLMTDTLTYVPTDSGAHQLTLHFYDTMGQQKDTSFTLTAVK
ncbi:hypothetical protein WBJ53_32935 (plasmid) [Spirosoma sp. SC4-14]|uniref:hypothetical protein n=1 Tax=Spirosoma sp. SC4-14 TaxID=3128900 RepID=UPI0030D3D39E